MSPYWKGRLLEYFCLGIPAYRLRFQVPLDLKTVQRWFRILRLAIYSHEMKEMRHLIGKAGAGSSLAGGRVLIRQDFKISAGNMALGIYKENGRVFTLPVTVPATEGAAKTPDEAGHLHFCDETLAYTFLDIHGNSVVTNGEKGMRRGPEIPEDIEGFWAFTRQWLKHYRGVPRKYFPLYLKEIEWRFNHRSENLVKLIRNLLDQKVTAESEFLRP
jgi:transposase